MRMAYHSLPLIFFGFPGPEACEHLPGIEPGHLAVQPCQTESQDPSQDHVFQFHEYIAKSRRDGAHLPEQSLLRCLGNIVHHVPQKTEGAGVAAEEPAEQERIDEHRDQHRHEGGALDHLGVSDLDRQILDPVEGGGVDVRDQQKEQQLHGSVQIQVRRLTLDLFHAGHLLFCLFQRFSYCVSNALGGIGRTAAKGVIITGASGNSSKADSTGNDEYIYPAAYDNVVSVGAVDKNDKVRTTSQKNDQVFVTAPGDNIALLAPSRNTRCTISSGTSYASPLVAAMAVAAKQEDRYINVDEFKALLTETSRDAGDEGYDTSYGHGIVDMKAFAAKLGGTRTASVQSYFLDGQSLQLTGLPKDIVDPQVVVSGKDGRLTGMAPVAPDENGVVTLETPAENGHTYTVKITSDNYDINDVEVAFSSEDAQSGLTQALAQAQAAVEAAQTAANEAQLAVDALPQDASAREIAAAYKKLDKANNALAAAQETVSSLKTQQSDLQAKQIAALEKELKDTKAQLKETEKQLSQAKAGTKPSASAAKKANAMKVTSVTKKVKKKKLKKKAVTVAPLTVKGATGTLSFQKLSGKKNLRIDTRTGKVVVAKKTKKGTYTMKVKVTASGNATTKSITKTVKVKIKVK